MCSTYGRLLKEGDGQQWLPMDNMRNCLNAWQHSVRCHLCCVEISLLFVTFIALSVAIAAYCSFSSLLIHTCELRVSIVWRLSCACTCLLPHRSLVSRRNQHGGHTLQLEIWLWVPAKARARAWASGFRKRFLCANVCASKGFFRTTLLHPGLCQHRNQLVRQSMLFGASLNGTMHFAYCLLANAFTDPKFTYIGEGGKRGKWKLPQW